MACIELNNNNFKQTIESNDTVLICFWATWCGHCKALMPVLDSLSQEFEGNVAIGKVDIEENDELADEYDIISVPTLFVFKKGAQVEKFIGAKMRSVLVETINKHIT